MKPLPDSRLWPQSRAGNELEARRSKRVGTKAQRCVDEHRRGELVRMRLTKLEREKWIHAAAREGFLSLSDWMRETCNARMRLRALSSADAKDVNTPRVILDAIKPMGPIGLDPFSNATSIVGAKLAWNEQDNSLVREWVGHGLVFSNPPFGDFIPIALAKMIEQAKRGAEQITLLPARIETGWFDTAAAAADVALWSGRVTFHGSPGNAPFPVCLLYFGDRRARFRRVLERHCVRILEATSPVFCAAPDPRQLRLVR